MAEVEKEGWKYILINGKSKTIEVKDSEFYKGKLTNLLGIRPFSKKPPLKTVALIFRLAPKGHKAHS